MRKRCAVSGVLGTVPSTIPGLGMNGSGFATSGGTPFVPTPTIGSSGSGFTDTAASLSSIAGALVEVLAVMTMIALVGVIIIAVVANRADPDPTGRRPQAVYYFVVSFITITTAIVGSALFVAALLWLTAHHSTSSGHAIARLLLASALITLVSAVLLRVHLRRGLILARADSSSTSPSKRVGQSYVSVVAFVAMLVLLVFSVISIYLVFAIVAPGTFGSAGGSGWAIRVLVESAYLVAVAAVVVWRHSSLLPPGLGIWNAASGDPGPLGASGPGGVPTP
jgi:hypothetical protein